MTDEELFKKNFPEYVTEKGVLLSPYWDLFSAGYETLEEENAELKKRNGELAGQKASLERWFGEAKAIIKDLLSVESSISPVEILKKIEVTERAEEFLKED